MAGTTRTLQVNIVGDSSKAQGAVRKLSQTSEKESSAIKKSFGSAFSTLGNLGIFGPFSGALSGLSDHATASFGSIKKKIGETESSIGKAGHALAGLGKLSLGAGALGFTLVAGESIKMASSFQSAAQHLVTDAGESQAALSGVEKGMLAISSATGTASSDIVNGMYHIESAGYHGAQGLAILKAAAEGAKVGGADLDTVSKTLTGTMRAYNIPASHAVNVMNELIATVGSGDMRMQDLASSLGNVAPVAAAAGVSLAQVGGAIATMTAQNMSADQATQDLSNTIRALQNPNNVAINTMQQLGINSVDISKNLGKRGLTGTIEYLSQTVLSKMGPSGLLLLNAFNQSKAAAGDLKVMLGSMSPAVRKVADEFMSGKMTMSQFRKSLPTNEMGVATQFATLYNKVHGFNDQLKAGTPAALTYNAAMAKIMGGATGLNTALMLTGGNAAEFAKNVDNIGAAAQKGGAHVDNWNLIQKTFSQQMDVAKTTVENLGIKIGLALIPKVETMLHVTMDVVNWFERHRAVAEALGIVIGGVLTVAVAAYAVVMAQAAIETIAATWPILAIIAAVVALGVGIYELVTHWSQAWGAIKEATGAAAKFFHDVWFAAWHAMDRDFVQPIEKWFEGIPNFVKNHLALIVTIFTGPFGLAVLEVIRNFGAIERWFENLPGWVGGQLSSIGAAIAGPFEGAWAVVMRGFDAVVTYFERMPSNFASGATRIGRDFANGIIWGVNAVINGWDWLVSQLRIPGFSVGPVHFGGIDLGAGLQIGDVPYLAQGGIVTGPMFAMLGDNKSGREMVVPLEKAGQLGFGGPAAAGPVTVEVPLYIDGRQFAKATARFTREELLHGRRNRSETGLS